MSIGPMHVCGIVSQWNEDKDEEKKGKKKEKKETKTKQKEKNKQKTKTNKTKNPLGPLSQDCVDDKIICRLPIGYLTGIDVLQYARLTSTVI